ncbi:MAG: class I SAM-dependent methyltransferase [Anaerolineales bacterium]
MARQLRELNREFYDKFAGSFADSRAATEPGVERILAHVKPGDRFLDLGCGNGRVAFQLPPGCHYVGVDFSAEILALAKAQVMASQAEESTLQASHFIAADLVADPWPALVAESFSRYDWILLRAVLHHVPGFDHRREIVAQAASLLAPEGRMALANWQFTAIPRLRKRFLPWETIGLRPEDVEPGDYLLDWQRDGYGLRYVHLIDEDETRRLAEAANLRIEEMFRADGHSNDLTLYAVAAPTP